MYPHYPPHPYPTILGSGYGMGAPSTVPTGGMQKTGQRPPAPNDLYEVGKPDGSWGPRGAFLRPGPPGPMYLPTAPAVSDGRALLPMRDIGDLSVEYFKIGRFVGRGGQIRLYLLGRQIKHSFVPVPVDGSWPDRKKELIESKRSCQGTLPVATHQGQTFCESAAILRYIAKKIGEYGQNHQIDYYSDMLVDKLAYWRDELMAAVQDWNQLDSPAIQRYRELRQAQYELFERVLNEAPPRYNLRPSWAHFALFSVIWDDLRLLEGDGPGAPEFVDLLKTCPRIQTLYDEVRQMPLVQQWVADLEPSDETPSNGDLQEVENVEEPQQIAAQITDFSQYYPAYGYIGHPQMYPPHFAMSGGMPMPSYPSTAFYPQPMPTRPMAYPPGSVPLYHHPGPSQGYPFDGRPSAPDA